MSISILFAGILFFSCMVLVLLAAPVRVIAQQETPNPIHVGIVRGAGYAGTVLMVIGFIGMIVSAAFESFLR